MTTPQHNHPLNNKLHDKCRACDLIRRAMTRNRAHAEVDFDLAEIYDKAVRCYPQARRRK